MTSLTRLAGLALAISFLALISYSCAKEPKSKERTDRPAATAATKTADKAPVKPPPGVSAIDRTNNATKFTDIVTPSAPGGDQSYTIKLDVPPSVAAGAEGVVRVMVEPKTGWKMNKEFPTRLDVTAPADATLAKASQSIEDAERFEDKGATFAIKFTAKAAGDKEFQAKLRFAVCTDATCDPKKQEMAWKITVQ